MMQSIAAGLVALSTCLSLTSAHMVATYPGWRGDNLDTNGTVNVDDYENHTFPYGMQWEYPCGGLKMSSNRTYWPIGGGAIGFQPGWFQGHSKAFIYVNLGINFENGSAPPNYSHPMLPVFGILGPTNDAYPNLGICLTQVPLPPNITFHEGQNATIQLVESAQHGAALYTCIDITFTNNMSLVPEIDESNCRNDSQIKFQSVFMTESLTSWAGTINPTRIGVLSAVALGTTAWLLL